MCLCRWSDLMRQSHSELRKIVYFSVRSRRIAWNFFNFGVSSSVFNAFAVLVILKGELTYLTLMSFQNFFCETVLVLMGSDVVLDSNGFWNIIFYVPQKRVIHDMRVSKWGQNFHICVNYSKGRQKNGGKGAGLQIQTCNIHFSINSDAKCEHLLQKMH